MLTKFWQRFAPCSFISTSEEWHAFVIGWAETACPWRPRHRLTTEAEYTPAREYHYYAFGRVAGFAFLILAMIGLARLIVTIF